MNILRMQFKEEKTRDLACLKEAINLNIRLHMQHLHLLIMITREMLEYLENRWGIRLAQLISMTEILMLVISHLSTQIRRID